MVSSSSTTRISCRLVAIGQPRLRVPDLASSADDFAITVRRDELYARDEQAPERPPALSRDQVRGSGLLGGGAGRGCSGRPSSASPGPPPRRSSIQVMALTRSEWP